MFNTPKNHRRWNNVKFVFSERPGIEDVREGNKLVRLLDEVSFGWTMGNSGGIIHLVQLFFEFVKTQKRVEVLEETSDILSTKYAALEDRVTASHARIAKLEAGNTREAARVFTDKQRKIGAIMNSISTKGYFDMALLKSTLEEEL